MDNALIEHIEEMIERYVRFPETLSEERRRAIELLLSRSAFFQAIARYYQDFYAELEALKGQSLPEIDSLLEELFSGGKSDKEE